MPKHKAFTILKSNCAEHPDRCLMLCTHNITKELIRIYYNDYDNEIWIRIFDPVSKEWRTLLSNSDINTLLTIKRRSSSEMSYIQYYNKVVLPKCLDLVDVLLSVGFRIDVEKRRIYDAVKNAET